MKTAKELFEKNRKKFYCKKRLKMVSDLVIAIYKNNDEDELTLLDVGCGAGSLFDNLVNYKKISLLDNIFGKWFYKIFGCRSLLVVAEKHTGKN